MIISNANRSEEAASVATIVSLLALILGATGSLALVLIWVYYTSMIVLFGAEFTKLWAQRYGKGIVPVEGAVAYVEEERSVAKG